MTKIKVRALKNLVFFFLTIALFTSCDKDDDYDHAKAVLAFEAIDNLTADKSLENVPVKIPAQIQNHELLASPSILNQSIENIAFKPESEKKFLSDYSTKWTGHRPFFSDHFVFEPIIKDNKIYLLDAKGILECYDLTTKKEIFSERLFPRKFIKYYQNPKIGYFNNQIFAIAGTNEVVSVNAVDGKILWRKTILSLPVSAPISDGKLVYVTTNDNKTYALNAEDGNLVWISLGVNKTTAIFGAASPVLNKNMLIVSYSSGEIYALKKENGEPIWTQDLNLSKAINSDYYLTDIDATPVIKDDIVYSIGNGGLIMAIDAKTGKYLWKKEIASISDFWIAGDFIYAINNDDKLIALKRQNGLVKWTLQLDDYGNKKKPATKIIYNGVTMIGDKLVITDVRGRLIIVNPLDGKNEQNFKINQKIHHQAFAVDGKIYLHGVGSVVINLVEVN